MIATVENTVPVLPPKQPPSVRDFEIYRCVKFECQSTRAAALKFDLSQTRVRQVIARVIEFMVESAPAGTDQEPSDERLYVAEQLAYERLDYLYGRAIRAFNDTQRVDMHGNMLPGRASFLTAAARITIWMARVPVHPLPALREEESDAEEEQIAKCKVHNANCKLPIPNPKFEIPNRNEHEDDAGHVKHPPVAECSVREVSRGDLAASTPAARDVTVPAEGTYSTIEEIKAAARRDFLRPAQADANETPASPASGDDESPTLDPLYARTPHNRRERRARERRCKRMLAKRS